MITVHHLNNSRSQRVLWLLEELGVPYEIKKYQRDAKTMLAPPELARVHPLGKSPVVTDDGVTVAESGRSSSICSRSTATAVSSRPPAPRSAGASRTGCTSPKARRCRRCS
jgi:hypothetical protein